MGTLLAVVKIDGKLYYQDDRLREYRGKTDFLNRIAFDDLGDRKAEPVSPNKLLSQRKNKIQ
jgi:hypothetical protein